MRTKMDYQMEKKIDFHQKYMVMSDEEKDEIVQQFYWLIEMMKEDNKMLRGMYKTVHRQLRQLRITDFKITLFDEDDDFIREFLKNRTDEIEEFVSNLVKEYKKEVQ